MPGTFITIQPHVVSTCSFLQISLNRPRQTPDLTAKMHQI